MEDLGRCGRICGGSSTTVLLLETLEVSELSVAVAIVVRVLVATPGVGNGGLADLCSAEAPVYRAPPTLREAEDDEEEGGCAGPGLLAAGSDSAWAFGNNLWGSMTFL